MRAGVGIRRSCRLILRGSKPDGGIRVLPTQRVHVHAPALDHLEGWDRPTRAPGPPDSSGGSSLPQNGLQRMRQARAPWAAGPRDHIPIQVRPSPALIVTHVRARAAAYQPLDTFLLVDTATTRIAFQLPAAMVFEHEAAVQQRRPDWRLARVQALPHHLFIMSSAFG